jgi:hypothetical protein
LIAGKFDCGQIERAGWDSRLTTRTGNYESVSLKPDKLASPFLAGSKGFKLDLKKSSGKPERISERRNA